MRSTTATASSGQLRAHLRRELLARRMQRGGRGGELVERRAAALLVAAFVSAHMFGGEFDVQLLQCVIGLVDQFLCAAQRQPRRGWNHRNPRRRAHSAA